MAARIYDFKKIHHLIQTIEEIDLNGPPTIQLLFKAKDGIRESSGKLGVFPSSFNPLTVSHVELIERAVNDFKMDEVLLVLDIKTLDKEYFGATLEDRLLMLLMYCEHKPKLSVGLSSHGLFVDKITALRSIYPEKIDIHFIVGFDTIIRVLDRKYYEDREHSLNELFGYCSFLATNRGERSIDDIQHLFTKDENRTYADRVKTFDISDFLASVSSTQVRHCLEKNQSINELVPPEIERFIFETELYNPKVRVGKSSLYDLRTQLIRYLYTLNPEEPSDTDLKKISRVARSVVSLGRELRRVTAVPGEEIPQRPEPAFPTQLAGNFDVLTPFFSLEEAQQEANRCLQCKHPPCERHCLPGLPILELLTLVSEGKFEQAYLNMREAEPLCGMTEYLCQTKENYCELHCLASTLFGKGQEIAIQTIFRTVWAYGRREYEARFDLKKTLHIPLRSRSKEIAVIGSGPAGIKAAMDLARDGYSVTLFERREKIGGIPRFETPIFRFPAEDVFPQIEGDIRALSIQVHTETDIGKHMTLDDLTSRGFSAVFVATGLTVPKMLHIPGENLRGVTTSIKIFEDFLQQGADVLVGKFRGKRGYVIDSGNTAMDTSRLLRRFGAEVACIFWKDKPRAYPKEIAAAKAEGVTFLLSSKPVELSGNDDEILSHIRVCQTTYSDRTKQWAPIPGAEGDLPADFCIYAIGARPDFQLEGIDCNDEGHICVNHQTRQTSIPVLFAGGDVVERGNISTAIRDGMKAAQGIHRTLSE